MLWVLQGANRVEPELITLSMHGSAGPATCLYTCFPLCPSLLSDPTPFPWTPAASWPLCSLFVCFSLLHFPFCCHPQSERISVSSDGLVVLAVKNKLSGRNTRKTYLAGNRAIVSNTSWDLVARGIRMCLWEVSSLQINSGLSKAEKGYSHPWRLWPGPAGHHPSRGSRNVAGWSVKCKISA